MPFIFCMLVLLILGCQQSASRPKIIFNVGNYLTELSAKSSSGNSDVILFYPGNCSGLFNGLDILSYVQLSEQLGLSYELADYSFINNSKSFFDENGQRKSSVLIIPGGIPQFWFMKPCNGQKLECTGVDNILRFMESGGSVITICYCGSALFVKKTEYLCSMIRDIHRGKYDEYYPHRRPGLFRSRCGAYTFDGTLRGPQESNMNKVEGLPPYPRFTVLPIRMNPENYIVRKGELPEVVHQVVVGGGSILPEENQPLDVVGWYPNGTAAIAIAPYGRGHLIMSNPHPNITGAYIERLFSKSMEIHTKNWGWTDEQIAKGKKVFADAHKDPDGPEPDWALAKSMLSYAFEKAFQQQ